MQGNSSKPAIQLLNAGDLGTSLFEDAKNKIVQVGIQCPPATWTEMVIPEGVISLVVPTKGISLIRENGNTFMTEPGISVLISGPTKVAMLFSALPNEFLITSVIETGINELALEDNLGIQAGETRLILNSNVLSPSCDPEEDFSDDQESRSLERRNSMLAVLLTATAKRATLSEIFALKISASGSPMFQILENIRTNPEKDWTLARLAEITNYSPFHVSRLFRTDFSIGFRDYVVECRARRAIEAICSGTDKLVTIGAKVGYADRSLLRSAIKSSTGFLPSDILRFARNEQDQNEDATY